MHYVLCTTYMSVVYVLINCITLTLCKRAGRLSIAAAPAVAIIMLAVYDRLLLHACSPLVTS
jgi:hypothetical protein